MKMLCPICLNTEFKQAEVLWPALVQEWELGAYQYSYINEQQGYHCTKCNSNLRSMTLAAAIMRHFKYGGSFENFVRDQGKWQQSIFLEINECGSLGQLTLLNNHILLKYPAIDMMKIEFRDESVDYVLHSDTLEHVPNGIQGLMECWRILKPGGALFFTIPILHERLTKSRKGLPDSYHGEQSLVHREYGADFYTEILRAGFNNFSAVTIKSLSSLAIVCEK